MNVGWSRESLDDLDAIYQYIAQDSSVYAQRTLDRIVARAEQIARHPRSGRKTPEMNRPQIREVIEGNYRIVYHIDRQDIKILTVLHGARRFPEHLVET